MTRAVYPGSFDPLTFGHLDVIERAACMFDYLDVPVLVNQKKEPAFSMAERVQLIKDSTEHLQNVRVTSFSGLVVQYLQDNDAQFIVRGLRFVSDMEIELQMASMNRMLMPNCDTIFVPTSLEYGFLSSSMVKEISSLGADVSRFVPPAVVAALNKRYRGGL